jgi:predicted DNA-binding transcriptional regulator YafY
VGWCRLREELRVFRLDRIVAVHDTGHPAPARDHGDLPLPCGVTRVTALV